MGFIALGINHRTAGVEVRERVSFSPEQLPDALQRLRAEAGADEVAILSTCNRTELYCAQEELDADRLVEWVARFHGMTVEELRRSSYLHQDAGAVNHMMRVAAGLDSMVLGEPQILGQMKDAWQAARTAGTLGPYLDRLFQSTFNMAKQVRTDTAIGENPVSVAFAAVSLARQIFADLRRSTALLIGAGETIALVARHLFEQGVGRIIVANRTLQRAELLSEPLGGQAIVLTQIPDILAECDVVISSTASPLPILGKGAVERALKQRRHKPMFMVDIAVPRDIEPEVGSLADVYLYTVDDLHEVIEENMRSRQGAAEAAERLIELGTGEFMQRLRALAAVDVVRSYRQKAEQARDQELQKALAKLQRGADPEQVMTEMARLLTNKLLHEPSVQLKQMTAQGRIEALALAQELFALGDSAPGNRNTTVQGDS
ncbi:glutamyl-tRNA reductase [Halopseudomonas aestusnigri]|jgi:glutamyl-tRNA reductase|uniref:glutamyl-tRNA reductase n=1 Tax=Halopseudomonas TaxID=2901189 RepID=UPI000C42CAFE|nr:MULTISPECIES: glutamyl-tRNA reductase [Halopseudomonas]MAK73574.1 glutamyl-tRNA reductase [Pseudomonadales bacterium]MEE2798494.1 glutamyl-tRNA reductase [Pseudomonadota bacterium]MAP77287.1 glutamyl-tRNA reductase [Pseudomonadales bacterium]MAY08407.1 glutamyl-tRNA reductase [Pseudomonadales bacterium]UGV29933.1 glutamyl-tRNA reductase [Halopseudomonas aestusnigri]|tara:strand:+ start:3266 stop:4561 length:1296 start_codon:yes stop_codon:yes gene_type:complete